MHGNRRVSGVDKSARWCPRTGIDNSFHDAAGRPLVNTTTFPDMGGMVKKAHSLGLGAGFYSGFCAPPPPNPAVCLHSLQPATS